MILGIFTNVSFLNPFKISILGIESNFFTIFRYFVLFLLLIFLLSAYNSLSIFIDIFNVFLELLSLGFIFSLFDDLFFYL